MDQLLTALTDTTRALGTLLPASLVERQATHAYTRLIIRDLRVISEKDKALNDLSRALQT